MQELKENLPVRLDTPNAKVQAAECDGMLAEYMQFSAGTDLTSLLEGLPNDQCASPHWGYMLEGSLHLRYADGKEEVTRAGQVFYWPPGHTAWTDEGATFVMFSPQKEHEEVYAHIAKKLGG